MRSVCSLFTLSLDYIADHIQCFQSDPQSLKCLPRHIKTRLLKKVLYLSTCPRYKSLASDYLEFILDGLLHSDLQEINLKEMKLNENMVDSITRCRNVVVLNLEDCQIIQRKPGNPEKWFHNIFLFMPQLQHLNVSKTIFGDSEMEILAPNCPHLSILQADQSKITENGLLHLFNFNKYVTCMSLKNTQTTDNALRGLVDRNASNHLRELRLEGCVIAQETIEYVLAKCHKLEIFTFSDMDLSMNVNFGLIQLVVSSIKIFRYQTINYIQSSWIVEEVYYE